MKKTLILIMVLAIAVLLVGCAPGKQVANNDNGDSMKESEDAMKESGDSMKDTGDAMEGEAMEGDSMEESGESMEEGTPPELPDFDFGQDQKDDIGSLQ